MSRIMAGVFAATLANQASAQVATTCQNRVVLDTIYQTDTGDNSFQYFVHIRNATGEPLTIDVTFSDFPANVKLLTPSLPGLRVGPNATRSNVKFGRGTNRNINTRTVTRVYDAAAGNGPSVRLSNCRPS